MPPDPPPDRPPDLGTAALQACTDLGRLLTGAAGCSVALVDPDEEHLRFVVASGEGADAVVGLRLPVSRGLAGWAVSSGQAITVDDVRADPRWARDVAEQTGYVPRSIVAVPLPVVDGPVHTGSGGDGSAEATGVLEVLDRTPSPDRDDLAVLASLAAVVSASLALARDAQRSRAVARSPAAALLAELEAAGPTTTAAAAAVLTALRDVRDAGGPPRLG